MEKSKLSEIAIVQIETASLLQALVVAAIEESRRKKPVKTKSGLKLDDWAHRMTKDFLTAIDRSLKEAAIVIDRYTGQLDNSRYTNAMMRGKKDLEAVRKCTSIAKINKIAKRLKCAVLHADKELPRNQLNTKIILYRGEERLRYKKTAKHDAELKSFFEMVEDELRLVPMTLG